MKNGLILLSVMVFGVFSHAAEVAAVKHGGVLRFEDAKVSIQPRLMNADWRECSLKGAWYPEKDGTVLFEIREKKDGPVVVEGRLSAALVDGKVSARWTFDIRHDFDGKGLFLSASLPTECYAGGSLALGETKVSLPLEQTPKPWLGSWTSESVRIESTRPKLSLGLSENSTVQLQDNRKWGGKDFSLRLPLGDCGLKAGERRTISLTVSAPDGVAEVVKGPLTIEPTDVWVPMKDTTKIVPGSALDFSALGWIEAPAGKYGRVVRRGQHFEFAQKPGVPQRFYGVNLCFSANYMSASDAEELVDRLVRTGYNALRIHHYERVLCDKADGTRILPERMAELDNLLNACIARGVYLTTDLFVSREVPYRSCGIDRDGVVGMQDFKELVLFHEGAFQNYLAFSREFLNHVNPKTGRRWADEPALAFLALVNEGNPGNRGYGFMKSLPEAMDAWRKWLADHKEKDATQYADITEAIPDNCWENSRQNAAFCLFLADVELRFARRMKRFVREEIKSEVLLTDLSCWKNPIQYQLPRQEYDYVDDHFYVDHPSFLEQSWRLPSKCPNTNPVRSKAAGFEAVVKHRLLDRPFTLTEFNYSGPGQYRGVGGMMLGAQAALQEYDGIWRFAWAHDAGALLESKPMTYFDVSRDPLQRMTERAVVALYLRRDLKPLDRTFAVVLPEEGLRGNFDCGPQADLHDMWYGWHSKFGTWVGKGKPSFATDHAEFPEVYSTDTAYYQKLAGDSRPGLGQVLIDRATGTFGVDTPRTAGFFAEGGTHAAGPLKAAISGAPAAVWVSSLDGAPVVDSKRLLLTHVTDVQDTGTVYADGTKTVLLKWGALPHLMHVGKAEISLAVNGTEYVVHALAADGSRRAEIPVKCENGRLTFTADTARDRSDATCLYEIIRK